MTTLRAVRCNRWQRHAASAAEVEQTARRPNLSVMARFQWAKTRGAEVILITGLTILSVVLIATVVGDWFAPDLEVSPEVVQDLTTNRVELTPHDRVHANADARVILVEVSDFECPFCGRHARETLPALKSEFIDSGRVAYAFIHLPLQNHPRAFGAAQAATCAAQQQRFWDMHERLFANQRALAVGDLVAHARALGLDDAAFRACLESGSAASVRADLAEASRLGVRSTPTFFLGIRDAGGAIVLTRRISGARPYAVFHEAIRETLEHAARMSFTSAYGRASSP